MNKKQRRTAVVLEEGTTDLSVMMSLIQVFKDYDISPIHATGYLRTLERILFKDIK